MRGAGRPQRTTTPVPACAHSTYHEQPRRLLVSVEGLELRPLTDGEACCGFGGTFCVKYPEISNRMVEEKVDRVEATGASLLLAGDLGCLMNMAGKLRRRGSPVKGSARRRGPGRHGGPGRDRGGRAMSHTPPVPVSAERPGGACRPGSASRPAPDSEKVHRQARRGTARIPGVRGRFRTPLGR